MDRARSTERITKDIETLSGPDYTLSDEAVRRYAYTPEYRNTLDWFTRELEAIDFTVEEDPVGTLYARNRPRGEPVFGIGSHCDSNRNGGRYDGTMGVVTALEVCRLSAELGFDLPLQLISFLEEEGPASARCCSAAGSSRNGSRRKISASGSARSTTVEAFGTTRPRRGTRPSVGASARTCSTTSPAGSRCTSSRRACSRTPATRSASSPRSPATSTPTWSSTAAGPRRGHADRHPARPDPPPRRDDRRTRASRHGRRRGHGGDGRRDRGRPGDHQCRCLPRLRFSLDIRGPADDAYPRRGSRSIAAYAEEAAHRRAE